LRRTTPEGIPSCGLVWAVLWSALPFRWGPVAAELLFRPVVKAKGGEKMVKCLVCAALGLVLLPGFARDGEDQPRSAAMVELIAAPEKFKDQQVTVKGYLHFVGNEHPHVASLYLSREDAENWLDNGVGVWANRQMLKNKEKLDNMYVVLTGKVRVAPAAGGGYVVELGDIKDCHAWSDPKHPIGLTFGRQYGRGRGD